MTYLLYVFSLLMGSNPLFLSIVCVIYSATSFLFVGCYQIVAVTTVVYVQSYVDFSPRMYILELIIITFLFVAKSIIGNLLLFDSWRKYSRYLFLIDVELFIRFL